MVKAALAAALALPLLARLAAALRALVAPYPGAFSSA
jgi:hypothetical protein